MVTGLLEPSTSIANSEVSIALLVALMVEKLMPFSAVKSIV